MSTVWKRTAAVALPDGGQLHATVEGPDDAPVTLVLAHGWTLSQAAWDDVADRLVPRAAARHMIVMPPMEWPPRTTGPVGASCSMT